MRLDELVWDEFNTKHVKKHRVTKTEVEEACENQIYVDKTYARRLLLVGRTSKKRLVSVVLAIAGRNTYYPVTARDSSLGERKKANEKNE